jgi:hypothetical protein
MESAAGVAAAESVSYRSAAIESASAIVKSPASESTSTAKVASTTPSTPAPIAATSPAKPRSGSDKDAAVEIARTVISVRRARVRVITIVAVSAHRRAVNVTRAHSDSHRYLGM